MNASLPDIRNAAIELKRYVKSIYQIGGFSKKNAQIFLNNAIGIVKNYQNLSSSERLSLGVSLLEKAVLEKSKTKRCELALMSSYFLMTSEDKS